MPERRKTFFLFFTKNDWPWLMRVVIILIFFLSPAQDNWVGHILHIHTEAADISIYCKETLFERGVFSMQLIFSLVKTWYSCWLTGLNIIPCCFPTLIIGKQRSCNLNWCFIVYSHFLGSLFKKATSDLKDLLILEPQFSVTLSLACIS